MARGSIAAPVALRVREDRAIFRALQIVERRAVREGEGLDAVSATRLFQLSLASEEREHFEVAFLDIRLRLIARERLFSGSVAGAEIHPRIVVQRALALNAASVICAHNHPSGLTNPSWADFAITERLRQALELVDVRLVDHVIVAGDRAYSMAAHGWSCPPSNPAHRPVAAKPRKAAAKQ